MKSIFRVLYSILLLGAGVLHFMYEPSFRKIVPGVLPFRKGIVLLSGFFEIIFAMLLWVRKGQQMTGKLLALFMIAVFPANIYMTIKNFSFRSGRKVKTLILLFRLPLQIPLIIGALTLGKREKVPQNIKL